MTNDDLQFHHLGLTTVTFDSAQAFYEQLGYRCVAGVTDPVQDVELRLLEAPEARVPRIELIKPRSDGSPVSRYLHKHGPCIYHTCFETFEPERALDALRASHRVLPVSPPAPAVLFAGRRVSFWQVGGVGLVELLEAEARAA